MEQTPNDFISPQSISMIPPVEFSACALKQFGNDMDRTIGYFETVILSLRDIKRNKMMSEVSGEIDYTVDSSIALNEKFLSEGSASFVLKYGGKKDFMAGLESYIGRPKNPRILQCMQDEHNSSSNSFVEFSPSNNPQLRTTPVEEWLFVIDPPTYFQQAAVKERFMLPRKVTTIEELMCSEIAIKAGLKMPEVVAARLYTGPMFKLYNDVLRNPPGPGHQSFVYTIHAFASCIVKLSRVHRITTLYRGIKGGALPHSFLRPDEYGTRGGVEYGFMSTTTVRNVAYDYAGGKDGGVRKAAVVYEIDEGAIDRGADVSWLSQFPSENEVVFPPLTNLEVFGEPTAVDGVIVTKLRVNINLRTLTVDEIVEKSRTQFLHMLEWYFEEVRNPMLSFDPYKVFPGWLEDFIAFKDSIAAADAALFNKHIFYRKAVDDALDFKEGTVQKVCVLKLLSDIDPASTHNETAFQRTFSRLRATRAAKFADPNFVLRYVNTMNGAYDTDGNVAMINYDLLWKLPLQRGSWAKLVRAASAVTPVRVTSPVTYAQSFRNLYFAFKFIKGLWRQLLGYVVVDSLLGHDGTYYYVGRTAENGKPFYQLSRSETALSCLYIYYMGTHWYIGSVLESESADLRSMSENDESPSDVRQWGKTTAPVLMAYLKSSCEYVTDPNVQVNKVDSCFGGEDLENGSEVVMNSVRECTRDAWTDSSPEAEVSAASANDGEKWALVHRLIEEQQDGAFGQSRKGSSRGGFVSADGTALRPLTISELHSIAVFCEQTKCPLPKEVSGCLIQEGTNAALASALLTIAVNISIVVGGFLILLLGCTAFVSVSADTFTSLAWFVRGHVFACALIGIVFWAMLLVALVGLKCSTILGILMMVTSISAFYFVVLLMGYVSLNYIARGCLAFTVFGLGLSGISLIVYSFLVG